MKKVMTSEIKKLKKEVTELRFLIATGLQKQDTIHKLVLAQEALSMQYELELAIRSVDSGERAPKRKAA